MNELKNKSAEESNINISKNFKKKEKNISDKDKDTKKKIKKKYNKKNKSELRKGIQYLEFREGDKIWLYSLHYYQENKTNIYYHCLDTKCKARAIYYYNFDKNEVELNNKFEIKHDHSLENNEHNYNQSTIIKNDLETK